MKSKDVILVEAVPLHALGDGTYLKGVYHDGCLEGVLKLRKAEHYLFTRLRDARRLLLDNWTVVRLVFRVTQNLTLSAVRSLPFLRVFCHGAQVSPP